MRIDRPRVLVIGVHGIGRPGGGAAIRTRQHVEILARENDVRYWNPTFKPWADLGVAEKVRVAPRLLDPRHDAFAHYVHDKQQERLVVKLAKRLKPDVLVVSEIYMAKYAEAIIKAVPGVKVVFDAHNHEQSLHKSISGPYRRLGIRSTENKMLRLADELWVCSEQDGDMFGVPYKVRPNGIRGYPEPIPGDLLTVGYVGGYDYKPNMEAARILLDQVLPGLPDEYSLLLVGNNPPRVEGGRVMTPGFVEQAEGYLGKIGVMCMPIKSGGGTRLKVLEAFSAGKPVVATPKAVEGIPVRDGRECVIRQTGAMPEAIEDLTADKRHRQEIIEEARAFVKAYTWEEMTYD